MSAASASTSQIVLLWSLLLCFWFCRWLWCCVIKDSAGAYSVNGLCDCHNLVAACKHNDGDLDLRVVGNEPAAMKQKAECEAGCSVVPILRACSVTQDAACGNVPTHGIGWSGCHRQSRRWGRRPRRRRRDQSSPAPLKCCSCQTQTHQTHNRLQFMCSILEGWLPPALTSRHKEPCKSLWLGGCPHPSLAALLHCRPSQVSLVLPQQCCRRWRWHTSVR